MTQPTTFENTARFLAQHPRSSRTGEDFFKCLTLDIGGRHMDDQLAKGWNTVPVDMFFSEFAPDEAGSILASLSDLEWYADGAVELRFLTRAGEKTTAGTSYDLIWMDITVHLRHPARVAEASLRAAREEAIRILAGRGERTRRRELEQHTILLVTLDGSPYQVPEVIVVGPSERVVDRDSQEETFSINVIYVPLNDDALQSGRQSDFANRLSASLGKLACSGDGWKEAFKESAVTLSDARNRFRRRLRERLEEVMQLLEETRGEACAKEKLGVLREAASVLAFRVMFLLELERRKRLYRHGPSEIDFGDERLVRSLSDEMGYVSPKDSEQREGASSAGAVVARLVHTVRAVRQEVDDESIAITGASIFANRPNDDFHDTLPQWLSVVERLAERANDPTLLSLWDRALKRVGSVMLGHLDDEFREELNLIGNGAARHRHRVLGNVYEQVLAMTPERGGDGEVSLTFEAKSDDRADLGAHYTPAELVEEVVRPTLGHLFRHYWEDAEGEIVAYRQLLKGITVVDPAMGSAHFLTVAALEIARELAWLEFFDRPRFALLPDWDEPLIHKNSIGHSCEGTEESEELPEDRFIDDLRHDEYETAVRRELPGVIRRSIYGVDINPLACELGKLSCWLFEVSELEPDLLGSAVDYPELTYLDANIRCGDSVAGVFLEDVWETVESALRAESTFHGRQQTLDGLFSQTETLEQKLDRAQQYRDALQTVPGDPSAWEVRNLVESMQRELGLDLASVSSGYELQSRIDQGMRKLLAELGWVFDLAVAIRYIGYTGGARTAKIGEMYEALFADPPPHGGSSKEDKPLIESALRSLCAEPDGPESLTHRRNLAQWFDSQRSLLPFHWEAEFPSIFRRGGFDAIVANPPFIGSQKIKDTIGETLQKYLGNYYFGGNAPEYAAFFFKRYARVLNKRAVFGSLAPNTIAQGKVRRAAIPPLVSPQDENAAFEFFRCCQNREWPGEANVHIAMVAGSRLPCEETPRRLVYTDWETDSSGRTHRVVLLSEDEAISSYLDALPDYELCFLEATRTLDSLQYYDSVKPLVITGFNIASSFKRDLDFSKTVPKSERDAIYAYYNNSVVKNQPTPQARKLVIDFTDALRAAGVYNSPRARQEEWLRANYEEVFDSLKESVGSSSGAWWQLERDRIALRDAWADADEVIVFGDVSKCWTPQIIPKIDAGLALEIRPTIKLYVMPTANLVMLGVISSPIFEAHLRRTSSTLKSDLSVVPSEAFPTFPMPWKSQWSEEEARPVIGEPPAETQAVIEPAMVQILELRKTMLRNPPPYLEDRNAGNWGITKLYNNFDNPEIEGTEIQRLRDAHRQLHDGVAEAFGWSDLVGCEWDFERPWLDGSPRFVPTKENRAKILANIDLANSRRRKQEDRLYCERIVRHIPQAGLTTTKVRELEFVSGLPFSTSHNDTLEPILVSGAEQGVLRRRGKKWFPAEE